MAYTFREEPTYTFREESQYTFREPEVDTKDIDPLPEADVSGYGPKWLARQGWAAVETAASLGATAATYIPSKIYGLMALPFGADAAKIAEEEVQKVGQTLFAPRTDEGKAAVEAVSKGFEVFLTPTTMGVDAMKVRYEQRQKKIQERKKQKYTFRDEPILDDMPETGGSLGGAVSALDEVVTSPEGQYLFNTGAELGQFAMAGAVVKGGKAKYQKSVALKKAKQSGLDAMELVRKRRADMDIGILDSEVFIREVEKNLTPLEQDAVPFIRQGIKDPEVLRQIGREDLIPIIEKPSPTLIAETKKIGEYYDKAHEFLKEHWDEDLGFVEDYVTQIWDVPKERKSEIINYFATKNPFTKKRTIPTLEEGIKLGLKPKTTNIAELLRMYDQYKFKTAFNHRFAEDLKNMVDDAGNPLMLRSDKAPKDWVKIDQPALDRAMAVGMIEKDGVKAPILSKTHVKVHPDIAKEVGIVFDQPFTSNAITAFETLNAYTKKSMLSLSFFHHFALTESAFSTGIGGKAVRMWDPIKIYDAVKNKNYAIYNEIPLAKDAIEHGVTFGALEDVQRGRVEQGLQWLETSTKDVAVVGETAKLARKANQLWDTALWDYYHNNLKLWAYEANVEAGLKSARKSIGRELTKPEVKEIKREMGGFVNDSFGGQNWELSQLFGNPKTRQMMHWILLAPDWTLSTLKQAMAPGRGVYKTLTAGKEPTLAKQTAQRIAGKALTKQGVKFWARAALYFNMVAQSANYYNTNRVYGKGRFTWDNAPGQELNIFAGHNPDGTERYIRMGKQFREVMEWATSPIKKFGSKLSPVVRETYRQLGAHDPGSGFPTEWADEEDFWKATYERATSVAEMPLPFSLRPYVKDRPTMFMFALPGLSGMTNYKTRKLFKSAIKEKSPKKIRRIYFSALENDLDAESLFKSAASEFKADITYDNKNVARDIMKELRVLDDDAKVDALMVYKERGILTPGIVKQLEKEFDKKDRIRLQKLILPFTRQ